MTNPSREPSSDLPWVGLPFDEVKKTLLEEKAGLSDLPGVNRVGIRIRINEFPPGVPNSQEYVIGVKINPGMSSEQIARSPKRVGGVDILYIVESYNPSARLPAPIRRGE